MIFFPNLDGGIPAASISISSLDSVQPSPNVSSSSLNVSALEEFEKDLNRQANLREYLIQYLIQLPVMNNWNIIQIQSKSLLELTQSTNQLSRSFLVRITKLFSSKNKSISFSRIQRRVDVFVWLCRCLQWQEEFLEKIFKCLRINSFNVRRIFSPFVSFLCDSRFFTLHSVCLGSEWTSSTTNECFGLGSTRSQSSPIGLRNRFRSSRRSSIGFLLVVRDEKSVPTKATGLESE